MLDGGGGSQFVTSLGKGVVIFVTECDAGGRGGLKFLKLAWRHLWMVPYKNICWNRSHVDPSYQTGYLKTELKSLNKIFFIKADLIDGVSEHRIQSSES